MFLKLQHSSDAWRSVFYFCVLLISHHAHGQSEPPAVIGCGGFVHWDPSVQTNAPIQYAQLKVQLFSESTNSLREVTEVLPNGAYSIVLYELSGVYRLDLVAPTGWNFGSTYSHKIDLIAKPDACATDFNFYLLGYTLFGQVVTFGLTTGPGGLSVRALKNSLPVQENITQSNGFFTLNPLLPGAYELTIADNSSPGKQIVRARSTVRISATNLVLDQPIVLLGHFARGVVLDSQKQPLNATTTYLLAKTNSAFDPSKIECTKVSDSVRRMTSSILPMALDKSYQLLCESNTDAAGQFVFDHLPGGTYVILPHHTIQSNHGPIGVSFSPSFTTVQLEHTDVDLGPSSFEISGFHIPPGVMKWPNGEPVPSAKIYIGDATTPLLTNEAGLYQPGALSLGHYTVRAEVTGAEFQPVNYHLDYSFEPLPEIRPSRLQVCGHIQIPSEYPADSIQAFVYVLNKGTKEELQKTTDKRSGLWEFCLFLPAGKYEFAPHVLHDNALLQFAPKSMQVHLLNGPVSDIEFTRFRANVTGRVRCLESCRMPTPTTPQSNYPFYVQLTDSDNTIALTNPVIVRNPQDPTNAYFEFENILPGDYVIQLISPDQSPVDGWCWGSGSTVKSDPYSSSTSPQSKNGRPVHIGNTNLDWATDENLDFIHIGYTVRFQLDTEIDLSEFPPIHMRTAISYGDSNRTSADKDWNAVFQLTNQLSKACFPPSKHVFELSVLSSHCMQLSRPEPAQLKWDRSRPSSTHLNQSPTVRLRLVKLPIHVSLSFDDRIAISMGDLPFTRKPIRLQVISNVSDEHVVDAIAAKWSTLLNDPTKLTAQTTFWLDVVNHFEFYLQLIPSTYTQSSQWEYTYLLADHATSFILSRRQHTGVQPIPSDVVPIPADGKQNSSDHNCPAELFENQHVHLNLRLAVLLRGEVVPSVRKADVILYRKSGDVNEEPIESTLTDPEGVFIFGPVPLYTKSSTPHHLSKLPDPKDLFHLKLNKPGFEFVDTQSTSTTQSVWTYKAIKLSLVEVFVTLAEDENEPLSNVLVSVIGEGYRGNQFTDVRGVVNFIGLGPGQYYVRALMKEHVFTIVKPQSGSPGQATLIQLTDGDSQRVEIVAERIAFSVSGSIFGLGELPLANISVEAVSLSNPTDESYRGLRTISYNDSNVPCKQLMGDSIIPREQATSNIDGSFVIRGLLPGCHYSISVPTTTSVPSQQQPLHSTGRESATQVQISRTVPAGVKLHMPPFDVIGLKFTVIPQMYISTISVRVDTADEYLDTLYLKVFYLDRPGDLLAEHKFSESMLFRLPRAKMPLAIGRDIVVRLENSLNPNYYKNIHAQQIVLRPKLDISDYHTFVFKPQLLSDAVKLEL